MAAFFKPVFTAEAVKEDTGNGASYINKSGIYDVTLKIVSVETNEHNARSLNFNIEHEGQSTTLYGLKLDNNDGTNNYQAALFNKLCVVCGVDIVGEPEIQTHNLGKDNKPTDLSVLTEFTDLDVKIRVQEEYSKYNDEIRKRMVIKNFYRADGASASEVINGTEIGVQLSKDQAYASNVTYKDGLTEEDIKAWKESFKDGKANAKPSAPVAKANTAAKPAKNLFG